MEMIKTRDAICSKLYRYGGDIGDKTGLLQAKFEVGHRVWDSRVWYTKLPNSKKMDLIKINKKKAKEKTRNKAKQIYV